MISRIYNRFTICVIAIVLLWITSLQLILGLVKTYFNAPSFSMIYQDCRFAYDTVSSEKKVYSTCSSNQISNCNKKLEKFVDVELQNTDRRLQHNKDILNFATETVTNCAILSQEWKSSLDYAFSISSNNLTKSSNSSSCTPEDTQSLESYLHKNSPIIEARKAVAVTASDYSSKSVYSFSGLAEYTKNLQKYSKMYIQNNQIDSKHQATATIDSIRSSKLHNLNDSLTGVYESLNQLIACSTFPTIPAKHCTLPTSTLDTYDKLLIEINNQNTNIKLLFSQYKVSFDALAETAATSLTQAQSLLQSIQLLVHYIINIYGIVGTPLDLCGKVEPDWCKFTTQQFHINIPNLPDLFQLKNLPSAEEISNSNNNYNQTMNAYESISLASRDIIKKGSNMLQLLNETLIANLFKQKYIPPDYRDNNSNGLDIDQEVSNQEVKSKEFETTILKQITELTSANQKNISERVKFPYNITMSSVDSNKFSKVSSAWTSFTGSSLEIESWLKATTYISNIFILIDIIYRLLVTLKYIRKYLTNTSIDTPQIDMRQKSTSRSIFFGNISYYCGNICHGIELFLTYMPFLALQLILYICFIGVVFAVFIALYIPEYYSFSANCVHNEKGLNGTFLSRQLYEFGYNFAASDGNGVLHKGINDYNTQIIGTCSKEYSSTDNIYKDMFTQMTNYNTSIQGLHYEKELINKCVNLTNSDNVLLSSCCDMTIESSLENVDSTTTTTNNKYYHDYCYTHFNKTDGATVDQSSSTTICPISSHTKMPYYPSKVYKNMTNNWCQPLPVQIQKYIINNVSFDRNTMRDYEKGNITDLSDDGFDNVNQNNDMLGFFDSRFDCTKMPICETTCNGPNENVILTATKRCSCMIEWYFNSTVLQTFFTIIIFILVNISRWLMNRGLTMIFWDYLTVPEFDYIATCSKKDGFLQPLIQLNNPKDSSEFEKETNKTDHYYLDQPKSIYDYTQKIIYRYLLSHSYQSNSILKLNPNEKLIYHDDEEKNQATARSDESDSATLLKLPLHVQLQSNSSFDNHDSRKYSHSDYLCASYITQNNSDKEEILEMNENPMSFERYKHSDGSIRYDCQEGKKNSRFTEKSKTLSADNHMEENLAKALNKGLRKYKLRGLMYVWISLLINLPWLVCLQSVKGNINYVQKPVK